VSKSTLVNSRRSPFQSLKLDAATVVIVEFFGFDK
jgi:hypothetical protein